MIWRLAPASVAAWPDGQAAPGLRPAGRGRAQDPSLRRPGFWGLDGGARTEHQRAHHARGAASAIHRGEIVPRHLSIAGFTHDLAGGLHAVAEAARVAARLAARQLAAVGVDRKGSLDGGVGGLIEVPDLALLANTRVFEAHGHENGVSVIEFQELHVSRA